MTVSVPRSLSLDVALRQAIAHHNAGRLEEAERLYRAILQAQPFHSDANHNLGVLALQAGRHAAALPYLKTALAINPTQGQYVLSYAETLLAMGDAREALSILQGAARRGLISSGVQALRQKAEAVMLDDAVTGAVPTRAEMNQLVALFNDGSHAEVESRARSLIERYPESGFAWKALGTCLQVQGKDALLALEEATRFSPEDAEAHGNLGGALHGIGRFDDAVVSYRRALEIKPDYPEAYSKLGSALRELGQLDDAVASYYRALEINPDYAEAHVNLGNALQDVGRFDGAVANYRRALQIEPDYVDAHTNLLFCLSHSEALNSQALFAEHCRFGEQFEMPLRANWMQHGNSRDPKRHLQIGFVSGDLYNHAVTAFIEPVLTKLSGYPELLLHAYYNHVREDAVTQRLRGYFVGWHPIVGLSNDALANRIRADGIDILIDLSGHTARNRLLTFARKPAPVQATWMGYPGTTGLRAMDYYLTDRFFLPYERFAGQFTEALVYLPASAPFTPAKEAPAVNALPALCNRSMTFGSFNHPSKISASVVALWARLLRALPDARMLLGGMPEEGKYGTLIEWFGQEGIAQERLSFHVRSGMDRYLGLHHQVDINLDTFPYNGGTTTLHALWMGVPTLTVAGNTPAGRTGSSILGHAGLGVFIAHDAEEFVQKGVFWAGNLTMLSEIRAGLREQFARSAMGQPELVAGGLERALRMMWQRWCAGLPGESFAVEANAAGCAKQEVIR